MMSSDRNPDLMTDSWVSLKPGQIHHIQVGVHWLQLRAWLGFPTHTAWISLSAEGPHFSHTLYTWWMLEGLLEALRRPIANGCPWRQCPWKTDLDQNSANSKSLFEASTFSIDSRESAGRLTLLTLRAILLAADIEKINKTPTKFRRSFS